MTDGPTYLSSIHQNSYDSRRQGANSGLCHRLGHGTIACILFVKLRSVDDQLLHTVSLRATYDLSSLQVSLIWILMGQQLRLSSLTTPPDLEMHRSTSTKPSFSCLRIRSLDLDAIHSSRSIDAARLSCHLLYAADLSSRG